MRITMDFKRTMISVARMLVLGLGLSLAIGTGVAQAQFRAAVFTQPVAAGATPSAAGVTVRTVWNSSLPAPPYVA